MKCCFSRRTICFLLSLMLLVCIVPMAANASTNYLTMDQAVVEIRNQLKERNEEFSVYIKTDRELTENDCIDMFYRAMEHTGKPTEGDYLQYHLKEMGATFSVELKDGKYNNCINYTLKYLASAQQEKKLDTVFRSTVDGLRLSELSDYHKVKFIYDYIISNITYDYAHKEDESYNLKASAYAALVDKTCVCQGYANLFYRMCLDAGIDCRILSGIGNGEDHAWNIVCLEGKYYNVDCTWDAELYQSGQESQYFLKSEANFGDHARAEEYKTEAFLKQYPMATKDYKVKAPDPVVGDEKDWTYIVESEKAIISSYVGNDEDVVVPSMLGGYPVIQVGWMGQIPFFRNNKVRSITFSEGIVNLGPEWACECENLEEIHYSSTVYGFSNLQLGIAGVPIRCPNLKSVTVSPNNPYYTVYKNDLYSRDMTWLFYHPSGDPRTVLKIPDGVIGISDSACEYAQNLKEVVMPDTVTHIGFWAFSDAINLKKVNISNACKSIMQFAFYRTALRTVHLPASLEEMHFDVFRECMSLERITVSEDNPRFRIHDGCLYEDESPLSYPPARSAKKHTVAPGARAILQGAFADAKNLEEVIIPNTVTKIGFDAFLNCKKLKKIHIPGSVTEISDTTFENCPKLTELHITDLKAWLQIYIKDERLYVEESTPSFENLYINGELVTEVKIPKGIKKIKVDAF